MNLRRIARTTFLFLVATMCCVTFSLWLFASQNQEIETPTFLRNIDEKTATQLLKSATPDQIRELRASGLEIMKTQPLNKRGLGYIAFSKIAQGDYSSYKKLIKILADLSLRNAEFQIPAIAQYLEEKNFRKGLQHADGLMRARPKTLNIVAQILNNHKRSKEFVVELARVLAQAPPWRLDYIEFELNQGGGPLFVGQLLGELRKMGAVISEKELRLLIKKRISNSDFEGAYFVWLDALPTDRLQKVSNIFDGSFVFDPKNLYFDWTISSSTNTRVAVVKSNEQLNDRYLSIDAFRETKPFTGVVQYLKISPGVYSFSYRSSSSKLNTSGGLAWKIYCLENPSLVVRGPIHNSAEPWTNYTFKFEIPPAGCNTQALYLESVGKTTLDLEMTGNIKFDDVKIQAAD